MADQSRDSDYAHLVPLFTELAALPPDDPGRVALLQLRLDLDLSHLHTPGADGAV